MVRDAQALVDASARHSAILRRDMRIDHVQLAAPPGCEQLAREFYGGLLGLTEIVKPERLRARGGLWFALDAGQQLHVGVEEPFTPAAKAHPALAVAPDQLDALAARLTRAGIELRWDDAIAGQRRFYVADPWGNRLELLAARPV
jgi:catechol 2,3-dioxygenase-like lactoylglutathione lyase family enzyme